MAFVSSIRSGQRPRPEESRGACSLPSTSHPGTALFAFAFLLTLALPSGVRAQQQQPGVILDSSEALFTILAARIAAGVVSASEGAVEARHDVAAFLAQKQIPVSAELRSFFLEHQAKPGTGGNLGQYVSLALLMGPAPEFKPSAPQTDLPPDAKALVGLVPLLKQFANQANLTDLWAQMQPRIQREIDRYSPPVRRSIEVTDAYLRFPGGAYLGRTYSIFLSLLGTPEQVHARIYGANYYSVVTPSQEPRITEIRHQYLHFLLDPLAVKYAAEIQQKAELKFLARTAPQLGSDFKEDFSLLVTECLIRAAELRIDKRPAKEAETSLEEMTAGGLILAPYFYTALSEYEKQDAAMSVAYKDIILKIDPAREKEKLAQIKFAPKSQAATAAQAPPLSQEELLLNQGEDLISEGKYLEARSAFKTVLETINAGSERALFGLGIVSSSTRKPGLAEDYFRKTLEVAQDVRIATWSHIYLGRLYDLQGERERALAQYRAASLTATNYPDAWRAVQDGMQRPFGFHK